jgi:mono/diheme cytochrome c family protein
MDRGQAVIGKHLFRSFCASCHGQGAQGDGSIADMLRVRPANLTHLAAENGGVFPFQRSLAVIDGRQVVQGHGTAEMPAWGDAFAEISESEAQVQEKISQLVHFIWSIQETPKAEE